MKNTYYTQPKTGQERYDVDVPEVVQDVSFFSRKFVVGSIHLKGVTEDVAGAIMMLCAAKNIPATFTLSEGNYDKDSYSKDA